MTLLFFLLAFGITWGALLPFVVMPAEQLRLAPWLFPLVLIGKYGPSLAGVLLASRVGGEAGLRDLFGRLVPRSVGWTAFALALPLATAAAATGWVLYLGTPAGPRDLDRLIVFAPFVARKFLFGGGLGEELGWRGFALPRMQRRMHPLAASVLLGAAWAAWHWPAFHVEASDKQGDSFAMFFAGVMSLSVIFTWVYNRSGGNLFTCALLHAAFNASSETFERALPLLWVNGEAEVPLMLVFTLLALFLIARTGGRLAYVRG